jgi:hypothetical protein
MVTVNNNLKGRKELEYKPVNTIMYKNTKLVIELSSNGYSWTAYKGEDKMICCLDFSNKKDAISSGKKEIEEWNADRM